MARLKRRKYPAHWPLLSRYVRSVRAQWRCECLGECGLHQPNPDVRRCVETDRVPALYAQGMVVLTVAHLCHDPSCSNLDHLRAMCNRCHLRYDVEHHKANAARTRLAKKEAAGQLTLFI